MTSSRELNRKLELNPESKVNVVMEQNPSKKTELINFKIMRKINFISLLVITIASFIACKSGQQQEQDTARNRTVAELWKTMADTTNPTIKEYKGIILNYAYTPINDEFQMEKNSTDSVFSRLRENKAKIPNTDSLIFEFMKNQSPQVRGWALRQIGGFFGVNKDHLNAAKEIIANEEDLYVIFTVINALSNEGRDPVVGKYLLDMAKHENPIIRRAAAGALANSWSKSIEGVVDAVITLMNDEDIEVRKIACRNSGKLADEKVIAPLVVILNNNADKNLHSNCMDALAKLWYDFPFFENTSEKAYIAFMNFLKKTPRTEDIPNWSCFSGISTKGNDYEKWRTRAKYFNVKNFCTVCTDIIKDNNAYWMLKTAAIQAIALHGTKADLQALKPVIDNLSCNYANLIQDSYKRESAK